MYNRDNSIISKNNGVWAIHHVIFYKQIRRASSQKEAVLYRGVIWKKVVKKNPEKWVAGLGLPLV